MPITPLHLGIGLPFCLNKNKRLSLSVFIFSQILMDIQPIITILFNLNIEIHGLSHTIIGALLISIIGTFVFQLLNFHFNLVIISLKTIFLNMLYGTLSHITLDSMMHSDVQLFYPFSNYKLLPLINIDIINYGMIGLLTISLIWCYVKKIKIKDIL